MNKNMNPRIMMVIAQFWPMVGGAEVQCRRLAKELINNNYSVQVLTGRWEPTVPLYQKIDGVPVCRHKVLNFLNIKTIMSLSYLLTMAWELWRRRDSFDIIHVHQALRPAYVAVIMAKLLKKPIIIKVGGGGMSYDLGTLKNGIDAGYLWFLDFLLWRLIRKCNRIIAISHEIEDQLRHDGFSERQIVYIPNGTPMPKTSPKPQTTNGKLRIVTLGRLDKLKGIDTIIEAARFIQEVTFHIAGNGPLEEEFQSLAKANGLGDRIFFEGLIEDVGAFMRKAEIFALPTRTEGMSNALLEAMAHRLACIVTPVGGNKDIIQHGENGLLVPPDNPAALAAAIRLLISNPELRANLASAGWKTVRSKYDIELVAKRYSEVYIGTINNEHNKK